MSSIDVNEPLQNYAGISTNSSSLSKWLDELGIPADDIEVVGHE